MLRPQMTARDVAVYVLDGWQEGKGRPESLLRDALHASSLDRRDRALAMEIAYGVVRNLTNLDFVLSKFIKETPRGIPPQVRNVLRAAAYQVIYLDRVPARAAVHDAVERMKTSREKALAGFVNAVLRNLIRGVDSVAYPDREKEPARCLSIKHSYPAWLAERWVKRFGADEAEALMAAGNQPPPITLRANTLKTDRAGLIAGLVEAGIGCTPCLYAPDGVMIKGYPRIEAIPGYAEGLFAVQDEAAQLVSILLSPKPGDDVLDACAAPGGKTGHISALSGGTARITAVDIAADKLVPLKENIARLGLQGVTVMQADVSGPLPFDNGFDRVLLDAPCSALGVIRRRPEIKYTRRQPDVARLARLQASMLGNLSVLVRPGGALVFSTCSTEPAEGETVIAGFIGEHTEWTVEDARGFLPEAAGGLVTPEGYMRTYPHRHGLDGFFAARLVRQ
ncbi:MAG: 16S rRNA (cytosine(967)-C(5))-methyltransferase RsmB [Nitrospirae bacterium]|nr:16S rRNA (cytosine(967)-C(5))-methyltransferase RsmB [Nitrospirota bacterium]MBI5696379.1 16S rRNA (cytosine(967)-C(5))-methyltransferase RsmB [Nitrospirota bacterium]